MTNSEGHLTIIDGATNQTSTFIDSDKTYKLDSLVAVNSVRNTVYALNYLDFALTVIDGKTNQDNRREI